MFARLLAVAAIAAIAVLAGCRGTDGGTGDDTSPADAAVPDADTAIAQAARQLCTARASCSIVDDAKIDACAAYVADHVARHDGVDLAACATCAANVTCAVFTDGACNDDCAFVDGALAPPPGTVTRDNDGDTCTMTDATIRATWIEAHGISITFNHWCFTEGSLEPALDRPGDHGTCNRLFETCGTPSGEIAITAHDGESWVEGDCSCGPDYRVTFAEPLWFELFLYFPQ